MAQLERPQRRVDTSKTAPTQTMEQLLRGEASKASPTFSSSSSVPSSFQRFKPHEPEEDHGHNQKKSVLTKVKEKAKKLRYSLSKRKHDDGNVSPSLAVGLENNEEEEGDAEYLGAPIYESEMAPEGCKENARQHPRATPVIPEKHVLSSTDNKHSPSVEHDREKHLCRSMSKRTTEPTTTTTPAGPNKKTMTTKTVAEKLTPAYAEGSNAAHSISSKIQGLSVSKPTEHHRMSPSFTATRDTSLLLAGPRTPPAKMSSLSQTSSSSPWSSSAPVTPRNSSSSSVALSGKNKSLLASSSAPVTPQTSSSLSEPLGGKNNSPAGKIWDKGVSVKEYLMNKLEPGEDEKALSQVISEAMSPRRTPGDAGVIEKVREAVTSLLRNEEPSKYAEKTPSTSLLRNEEPSNYADKTTITCASSQIPVSTNAQEVGQEENHGRILQAN